MARASGARRGRRAVVVLGAIAMALALAGCVVTNGGSLKVGSAPYEQGSGTLASETRPLADFHAVSASQGIEVLVSSGDAAAATVSGDDNLLAHVTTTVSEGTLLIAIEGSIETHHPLKVEVTAASPIDALAAVAGASIDSEDLHPDRLEVRASSGASVRGGGRAGSLELSADSGSTIDLRNVEAAQAQVSATAGSTVHVRASDAVRGSSRVGSTVRLYGNPATVDVAADTGSTVSD